jgi:Fic family protein
MDIENSVDSHFRHLIAMAKPSLTPGRTVSLGKYSAFVPAPLPPVLEWTPRLIGVLSDSDRLIGRLAGEGGRLPNPHVLMRPFVRREAVLSSKIEGTRTTLGELLAAEAGVVVERSPEDLREVGNYVAALEHGISLLKELPLCVRLVRELHKKLMEGVRGQNAKPGVFRKTKNGSANQAVLWRQPPSFHRRQAKSSHVWQLGRSSSMNPICLRSSRSRLPTISSRLSIRSLTVMGAWGVSSSRYS